MSTNRDMSYRAKFKKCRRSYAFLVLFAFILFSCDKPGSKTDRETGTAVQKEGSVESGSIATTRDAVSNDSSTIDTGSIARDAVSKYSASSDTGSNVRDAVSNDTSVTDSSASDSSSDAASWENSGGLGPPEPLFTFRPRDPPTELVYGLRIDDEYLYWMQGSGRLMRGKKSGEVEPEQLAESTGGSVWSFYVDSEHVYWVKSDSLGRYNKATGEVSSIALDGEHTQPLQPSGDDEKIYLVEKGCAKFVYVSKADGSLEVATFERIGGIGGGGGGGIAVDETHVYCNGAGEGSTMGSVYRRSKSGGEIEKVVTMPINDICNNHIVGIFIIDDLLYFTYNYGFCTKYSGGSTVNIGSVPKEGGEATEVVKIENSVGGGGLYDSSRKTIYYWSVGTVDPFVKTIANYSVENNRLYQSDISSFVDEGSITLRGTLVDDEDFVY